MDPSGQRGPPSAPLRLKNLREIDDCALQKTLEARSCAGRSCHMGGMSVSSACSISYPRWLLHPCHGRKSVIFLYRNKITSVGRLCILWLAFDVRNGLTPRVRMTFQRPVIVVSSIARQCSPGHALVVSRYSLYPNSISELTDIVRSFE